MLRATRITSRRTRVADTHSAARRRRSTAAPDRNGSACHAMPSVMASNTRAAAMVEQLRTAVDAYIALIDHIPRWQLVTC